MQKLDYAQMGSRIQQIRKAKGWSQEMLAKKCGISLNFVSHIERGTRKMSMDTFANLQRAGNECRYAAVGHYADFGVTAAQNVEWRRSKK